MEVAQKKEIAKQLAKPNSCFVLITCTEPCPQGTMEVQMSHGGDIILASYLLQKAQSLIDEKVEEGINFGSSVQALRLVD